MNLLQKRMQKIKESLRQRNTDLAASLLISTVSSDDMFSYWSGCCQGSERVPKILKYIKHIQFDQETPTARINFKKGELCIGVDFFINHIDGPEDLLFILTHERDHLILRKLFPEVLTPDYPGHLFNFGEDVYINAISRRFVPSTLPERYYKEPMELLLTGKHSQIDWDIFKVDIAGYNNSPLKDAHGALYQQNFTLLKAINEYGIKGQRSCGYQSWMQLIFEWHLQSKERSRQQALNKESDNPKTKDPDEGAENANSGEITDQKPEKESITDDGTGSDEKGSTDYEDNKGQGGEEHAGNNKDTEDQDVDEELSDNKNKKDEGDLKTAADESDDHDEGRADKLDEAGGVDNSYQANQPTDIETGLKNIVPLVQTEEMNAPLNGSGYACGRHNLCQIPLPDIKPNDPIVKMILATCELHEFRERMMVLEGEALKQVEGLIKGVLSDRATERSYDGYSVSVPFSITRRDVFSLSSGQIPVLWQRRVGIERAQIDLYVDVSGSMNKYYGYIPFIYDALKHVMGRIFQFSDRVVEVDNRARFLYTTGGTNFNNVALHMIKEQVQAAILLSDGMATLSGSFDKHLKQQLQHLFYIKVMENTYKSWEQVATRVIVLQKHKEENHV